MARAQDLNKPMDYDPETGEFPDRPELDDEVDENVLASMASSKYA